MPYQESSFLDGLAAGLTATSGRPLQNPQRTLLTGTSRVSAGSVLNASYDTFVSRISVRSDSLVTVLYEYGPANAAFMLEARKVPASAEAQTVYHVCQVPQAVPMRSFRYNVYLLKRDDMEVRFDARFAAFPYQNNAYPGSPEQVNVWIARSVR